MTVKDLIDKLMIYPQNANMKVVPGGCLYTDWEIDKTGVIHDKETTVVIVTEEY